MLTDVNSHFGGALAINGLDSTTKNFTADLDISGAASTAVDAQGHPLSPDGGMPNEGRIDIFTVAGITGNGVSLTVRVLTDDDVAFGSARTVLTSEAIVPGSGGIAAGTKIAVLKLPEGLEHYIRLVMVEAGTAAVGAGATISARYFLG